MEQLRDVFDVMPTNLSFSWTLMRKYLEDIDMLGGGAAIIRPSRRLGIQ